jgi:hypothetical protein
VSSSPHPRTRAIATQTAKMVSTWLDNKFGKGAVGYVRIDGVPATAADWPGEEEGEFVLMEVEAIEPHLWIETTENRDARSSLYEVLLGGNKSRDQDALTMSK